MTTDFSYVLQWTPKQRQAATSTESFSATVKTRTLTQRHVHDTTKTLRSLTTAHVGLTKHAVSVPHMGLTFMMRAMRSGLLPETGMSRSSHMFWRVSFLK